MTMPKSLSLSSSRKLTTSSSQWSYLILGREGLAQSVITRRRRHRPAWPKYHSPFPRPQMLITVAASPGCWANCRVHGSSWLQPGTVVGSILTLETGRSRVDADHPPVVTRRLVIASDNGQLHEMNLTDIRSVQLA